MNETMKLNKALIVDDNEIDALVCSRLIKKLRPDSQVTTLHSAPEALSYLKDAVLTQPEKIPDLIILDLYMPLMNGWFFLKEYLRFASNINKHVVILIASSNGYERDFKQMRDFKQISGYIGKPFTIDKMMKITKKYF